MISVFFLSPADPWSVSPRTLSRPPGNLWSTFLWIQDLKFTSACHRVTVSAGILTILRLITATWIDSLSTTIHIWYHNHSSGRIWRWNRSILGWGVGLTIFNFNWMRYGVSAIIKGLQTKTTSRNGFDWMQMPLWRRDHHSVKTLTWPPQTVWHIWYEDFTIFKMTKK